MCRVFLSDSVGRVSTLRGVEPPRTLRGVNTTRVRSGARGIGRRTPRRSPHRQLRYNVRLWWRGGCERGGRDDGHKRNGADRSVVKGTRCRVRSGAGTKKTAGEKLVGGRVRLSSRWPKGLRNALGAPGRVCGIRDGARRRTPRASGAGNSFPSCGRPRRKPP